MRKKLSLSKILHCVDPDDQHGTLLLKKEKTVPANKYVYTYYCPRNCGLVLNK